MRRDLGILWAVLVATVAAAVALSTSPPTSTDPLPPPPPPPPPEEEFANFTLEAWFNGWNGTLGKVALLVTNTGNVPLVNGTLAAYRVGGPALTIDPFVPQDRAILPGAWRQFDVEGLQRGDWRFVLELGGTSRDVWVSF